MAFISFIIATYNCKSRVHVLKNTVNRLKQLNVQFLVADGGSDDGTLEELSLIPGIEIVCSEPDKGIYDAWNKALVYAKGKYISFIGVDDIPIKEFILEAKVKTESSGTYPAIIYGNALTILGDRYMEKNVPDEPRLFYSPKPIFDIIHQGAFHLNELFKQHKFNVDFLIAGDYFFLLQSRKQVTDLGILKLKEKQAIIQLGGVSDSYDSKTKIKIEYEEILKQLSFDVDDLNPLRSKIPSLFSNHPKIFSILRNLKWQILGAKINDDFRTRYL